MVTHLSLLHFPKQAVKDDFTDRDFILVCFVGLAAYWGPSFKFFGATRHVDVKALVQSLWVCSFSNHPDQKNINLLLKARLREKKTLTFQWFLEETTMKRKHMLIDLCSYPFPWRVCQGIEMIRFVLVLYSISVSRVALTDLMDLAVPFPAEKSVGQMVMPIALGLLRRCFLVGFPDKVGGFETSPISRKLRGCFFSKFLWNFHRKQCSCIIKPYLPWWINWCLRSSMSESGRGPKISWFVGKFSQFISYLQS